MRGHRRGRTAGAGAASDATGIPRVACSTLQRAIAGRAVGELVGQGLADNHRPGFAHPLYAQGIAVRLETLEMRGAVGGDVVKRVDVVFDRDRHAVQRAQVQALGQQRVPALRACATGDAGIDLNERINRGFKPRCVQGGLRQLDLVTLPARRRAASVMID